MATAMAAASCSSRHEKKETSPPPEVVALAADLERDVRVLAVEIGPRAIGLGDTLPRTERWITERFRAAGLEVVREPYQVADREVANLVAELPGTGALAAEIIVVGAHYDTVPGTPGANDNGSGVAALLALAPRLAATRSSHARTVRLVAFVNEEPPFFKTEQMGSLVQARACRARGDNIVAMLSLETMGYFSDEPDSQHYPPIIGWLYPSRGNFIGIVGNRESAALVRRVAKSFRRHSDLPCEAASLPGSLQGIGWSDHWAFWQAGYSGVMITDTAPFRYPHYHEREDTPEKLDHVRLARVVLGLEAVLRELAGTKPL
jgi:Zn-dependent M28 family amino/carboxypeptidase